MEAGLDVIGPLLAPIRLAASILHGTIEGTETTPEELERAFGLRVPELVAEVTDDKISNVRAIGASPQGDWPLERRREYIEWARSVVEGCRGANAALGRHFDRIATEAEALPIR